MGKQSGASQTKLKPEQIIEQLRENDAFRNLTEQWDCVEFLGVVKENNVAYAYTLAIYPQPSVILPARVRCGAPTVIGQALTRPKDSYVWDPVWDVSLRCRLLDARFARVIPLMIEPDLTVLLNIERRQSGPDSFEQASALVEIKQKFQPLFKQCKMALKALCSVKAVTAQIKEALNQFNCNAPHAFQSDVTASAFDQILQVITQQITLTPEAADQNIAGALYLQRGIAPAGAEAMPSTPQNGVTHQNKGRILTRAAKIGIDYFPIANLDLGLWLSQNYSDEAVGGVEYEPNVSQSGYPQKLAEWPFDAGSEIRIPLLDHRSQHAADHALVGVITVVCAATDAFVFDADRGRLEDLGRAIVPLIQYLDQMNQQRIKDEREQFHERMEEIYSKLYGFITHEKYEMDQLHKVNRLRHRLIHKIVREARVLTDSDVALLAPVEHDPDRGDILVMKIVKGKQKHHIAADIHFSWSATDRQSVSSCAFMDENTCYVPDTRRESSQNTHKPHFPGIQSEISTCVWQGDTKVGILNIESCEPHHYTAEYQELLEFLAQELQIVLAAIDAAINDWFLYRRIMQDNRIARYMRHSQSLAQMRAEYEYLLQTLVEETQALTGATLAQIYVAANTGGLGNGEDQARGEEAIPLDLERGRFILSASAPRDALSDNNPLRFNRIDCGMCGLAFRQGKKLSFRFAGDSSKMEYISNQFTAESAHVRPIYESDKRPIGVLNLESKKAYTFTRQERFIVKRAALLATGIMISYRQLAYSCMKDVLMRHADTIMPDTLNDLTKMLANAARAAFALTGSELGKRWGIRWARIDLFGTATEMQPPFTVDFQADDEQDDASNATELSPVMAEVRRQRQAQLILHTHEPNATPVAVPWAQARSLICVPIPVPAGLGDQQKCAGLLTVASQHDYLTDNDREILDRLGHVIADNLRSIAVYSSRAALMGTVRDFLLKFSVHDHRSDLQSYLDQAIDEMNQLSAMPGSTRQHIHEARRITEVIQDPLEILHLIMMWYIRLADGPQASSLSKDADRVTTSDIRASMWRNLERYGRLKFDENLNVEWTDTQRATLNLAHTNCEDLEAVIFACFQSACAVCEGERTIHLDILADGAFVTFRIGYVGQPLHEDDFIPTMNYRDQMVEAHELSEKPLYEARRNIRLLGGEIVPGRNGGSCVIDVRLPHRG